MDRVILPGFGMAIGNSVTGDYRESVPYATNVLIFLSRLNAGLDTYRDCKNTPMFRTWPVLYSETL